MQRLADIDVAEPSDDSLIEQRGFEAGLLSLAGLSEHRGVERVAERFGAPSRQRRFFVVLCTRDVLHRAKTARVADGHDAAGRHTKRDMTMREMPSLLVMVPAQLFVVGFFKNEKR